MTLKSQSLLELNAKILLTEKTNSIRYTSPNKNKTKNSSVLVV